MSTPLQDLLKIRANGLAMSALTVMAAQTDPYRQASHEMRAVAEWLMREGHLSSARPRHPRGLHYRLIGRAIPDGTEYHNTDDRWIWIQQVLKAGRWMGVIPFDAVADHRNEAAVICRDAPRNGSPFWSINDGGPIAMPTISMESVGKPCVFVSCAERRPYRIVLIAEKSSAEPIFRQIDCDEWWTPSGEASDYGIGVIAKHAAEDGRPCVVGYLSDFDPSGFEMPLNVARKFRALRDLHYPDLDIRVIRLALTKSQCETWDLPSTPLKATEKRADAWEAEHGRAQTEIDAAIELQPHELIRALRQALNPYRDDELNHRRWQAAASWENQQSERLSDHVGGIESIERRNQEIERMVSEHQASLEDALRAVLDEIRDVAEDFLPSEPLVIPDDSAAMAPDALGEAFFLSTEDWVMSTKRLQMLKHGYKERT